MNDSFPVPAIVSAGINARSEAMPLLLKCQYPCANLGRSSQILAKANKPCSFVYFTPSDELGHDGRHPAAFTVSLQMQ
jgi:hypothetical protein